MEKGGLKIMEIAKTHSRVIQKFESTAAITNVMLWCKMQGRATVLHFTEI